MRIAHAVQQAPAPKLVQTRFDPDSNHTLWLTLPAGIDGSAPHFSPELLNELHGLLTDMQNRGVSWPVAGGRQSVHYTVMRSAHPDYFSLGGDLLLFRDCILRKDVTTLRSYSMQCASMLHEWSSLLGHDATTIALVQGRALGGGFETALAADYIVAEEHSEFGFPEILFGLFPCTGGMSLLAQRIGIRAAERMLSDGRIYNASALKEMGIVDEVCARGEGQAAVEKLIANHARQRQARLMLQRSRRRLQSLDLKELRTVVEEWTQVAMQLSSHNLRVMDALAKMQRGRAAA